MNNKELKKQSQEIRLLVLEMIFRAKSSHIGSCFSLVDILCVLYFKFIQPSDRCILSKGHSAATLYAILYKKGYFLKCDLDKFCSTESFLTGHVNSKVPGVFFSTGSLGHGLSVGCGVALAKQRKNKRSKIYILLGDGDLNEGSTWEAIMFADQYKLSNLIAIIDYNKIQSLGLTAEIMNLEPLIDKFSAFGWNCLIVNGHNFEELEPCFQSLSNSKIDKPTVVIAHTVKGKGVSFMENSTLWHYRNPNEIEFNKALAELSTT